MINFLYFSQNLCILFCIIFFTSPLHFVSSQPLVQSRGDFFENCDYVDSTAVSRKTVYRNWPFKLDCEEISSRNGVAQLESECYVESSELRLQSSNISITLPETSSQTITFSIYQVSNESQCFTTNETVNVGDFPSRNCTEEVFYQLKQNVNVVDKHYLMSDTMLLECMPSPEAENETILPPSVPSSEYKTTWWRSQFYPNTSIIAENTCLNYSSYLLPIVTENQKEHPNQPDDLVIYDVNFWKPGLYSCEVTYNEQSAFIAHYSVCIENDIHSSQPSITCIEETSFLEGDRKRIECSVQSSNAKIQEDELAVQWRRKESDQYNCDTVYLLPEESGGSRAECGLNEFLNRGTKCFYYVPQDEEFSDFQDKNTFKIYYELKNLKKADAGTYTVRLRYQNVWSDVHNIEIKFNPEKELQQLIKILTSILAVLIASALAGGLIWYQWIQIQLFYRRHFPTYDEDDKQYVAILSYLYSNGLSEKTQKHTKTIVKCIQERMKKLEYQYFDKYEDFQQGAAIETLLKYLNDSHRMVIVLTDAYVEEKWTLFEAQQGYINMLKNKSKLIIIRAPGSGKALKRLAESDTSKGLKEAVKASRNIRWTEKEKDERFMDAIECALPNLKRSPSSSESKSKSKEIPISNHISSNVTDSPPDYQSLDNFV